MAEEGHKSIIVSLLSDLDVYLGLFFPLSNKSKWLKFFYLESC